MFKTSVGETDAGAETAKELELDLEPEGGTELLQSHNRHLWMRSCFLWLSEEGGFLGWHLPDEDVWRLLK